MELDEVLDASILIGYHLLCNGADVYRVEQSIDYICDAYGVKEVHSFAIPSSIVVTISDGRVSLTKTKRILNRQTNLNRVEKLTGLSRYICAARPEYPVILNQIEEILSLPVWGLGWQYGAHFLAGSSFCLFFGGNFWDCLISGVIGAFIMFVTQGLQKLHANSFFINIICSFFAALMGGKISSFFPELFHADKIIIGGIMLLVPGLALANSMRDFIASDTMTGLSRMAESLFVAVGVAFGVACAMFFL
ncbi:MAG: threonine/serine exporter family protein [Acetivibrio sp.]